MDDITKQAYWKEVEALARDCVKEARENERDLSDVIFETVDGHQWVIYTFYHHQVLQHADTDPAKAFEDMGGPDMTQGWDHVVMQAAFLALRGDVEARAAEIEAETDADDDNAEEES